MKTLLYTIAGVYSVLFGICIGTGLLPHGWDMAFYFVPVGLLTGWAEVVMGLSAGVFMFHRALMEGLR